jgi:hypothetical protein
LTIIAGSSLSIPPRCDPISLPKTLETDFDQTYKFVAIRMYFADLDKKLGGLCLKAFIG